MKKEIKYLIIILSIVVVVGGSLILWMILKPKSSEQKETLEVEEMMDGDKGKNKKEEQSSDKPKEENMEQVSQDEWLQAYREADGIEEASFFLFYFSKNSLVPYLIAGPTIYHYENGEVEKVVTDMPAQEGVDVYIDDAADIMLIQSDYNWYGGCTVIDTNTFEMIDEFEWCDSENRDTSSYIEYYSMGNPITSYDYEQKMQKYECYQVEKCLLGSSLTDGQYMFYYDKE